MTQPDTLFREKAEESLAGAVSEYANARYNNCANRCYHSCFQAAVQALHEVGVTPPGARGEWSHDQLQATFTRELINRRKRYPAELCDVLPRVYLLREVADYKRDMVSEVQAARALRRTRTFLQALQAQGGEAS